MKASELRIGNYVKRSMPNHDLEMDRHTCQISSGDLYAYSHHIYRPIPLTEDWLIKFGFEINQGYAILNKPVWILRKLPKGWGVKFWQGGQDLEYVHQLQNLYFALTGEELTIKETVK